MARSRFRTARVLCGLLVLGCSLSPLHRKIKVGEEAFVVFLATGADGKPDLFASTPTGGEPVRLTFTAMAEALPRLTPRGDMMAFVRARSDADRRDLVVMNLLSGAERLIELPPEAGTISALGWSRDQAAIYVQGSSNRWRVSAPPAPIAIALLDSTLAPEVDSALMVVLGTPSFARAEECATGGVCVIGPSGTPTRMSATGRAPFRWGRDSLAWFEEDRITIRPLGPGTARRLTWTGGVHDPRDGSYAEP